MMSKEGEDDKGDSWAWWTNQVQYKPFSDALEESIPLTRSHQKKAVNGEQLSNGLEGGGAGGLWAM